MDESKNCTALSEDKACFKLDRNTYDIVCWIKFVVLSLGMLLCSLAIGMIIFFKAYKKFVHRLALYLVIAAFFNSLAFILNSQPVERNKDGHIALKNNTWSWNSTRFCIATGFLDHFSKWLILLLVFWITLQLFMLGVLKRNYNSSKHEVGGVMAILVTSLVSSFIPLRMYGLTGTWCWIKTEKVGAQFGLWYGFVVFFVTLNFIAVLAVIVVLYRGTQQTQGSLQQTYKKAFREALPLLFYPIIFSVIYSLAFVHRVYYASTEKTVVAFWAIHAIVESSLPLFIPLAFLLHPNTLKMLKCYQIRKAWNAWRQQSEYTQTHFVVSREAINEEESERLVITGSRRSETSEYKTLKFLEIV